MKESHNHTPSTEGGQKSGTTNATSTRQPQVTRPHKQLAHILWSSKLIIDHIIAVALMRDHTFSSSLGLSKRWIHIETVWIFLFMPRNTFGRARLGRNKLRCQERSKARKGTWQKAPLRQKTWRIWHQMASKVERFCILIFKHNLGPRGPTRTRRKARTNRVDAFCSLPRQVNLDERNLSGLLGLKIQKVKMKPWKKRKRRSCLEILENGHCDVPSRSLKVRLEVATQFSSSAFIS